MADPSRSIESFRVQVHHRSVPKPVAEYVGTGDEWRLKPVLSVPYADLSYSVRIDTVWVDLLRSTKDRLEQTVEGLCTIVKFGDTLQLREPFRVVIELEPTT